MEKGVTQAEFAALVGLSKSFISNIEANVRRPSLKNLAKICRVLDMPQPVFYLLSIDPIDLSRKRRKVFKLLFPIVQQLMFDIIGADGNN